MTKLVFDIEANGLYESADTIWCVVTRDLVTGKVEKYGPKELSSALDTLSQAKFLIGHNIINYDLPLLKKLLNWEPEKNVQTIDTLVMSRLFHPDRGKPAGYTGKSGPHSLEAWGYRVGRGKVAHEDWSVFSPAMLRRCSEDVEINAITYATLLEEVKGHNWKEALEIEYEVSRIITQQEINGVNFDRDSANSLIADLQLLSDKIDNRLLPNLPKRLVIPYKTEVKEPYKKNGELKKQVLDWFIDSSNLVGGPFTRISYEPMNLGSQTQVKEYLLSTGWQPTQWNYKDGERTSPKLTEDSYGSIKGDIGGDIKDRILYRHRQSQIEGWVENTREDGRITAGANTCGTNTGRFRHFGVVNVPKASDSVFYGKEMRSLFTCSPGRLLVGHDASGLELRMLAHYMDDPAYTYEILHGDIHSANQLAAGLPTRDDAKTFIYAFLYGAGDEKIGNIIGGESRDGAELKRRFLSATPALAALINKVRRASKKGYLKGLDGRKIWMRRNDYGEVTQHKALNTLLQSAGAVVMKKSSCILDDMVRTNTLDVLKVIDMHDEAQADVLEKNVEKYCELAVDSIVQSGKHFNLRCPLAAEAKVGNNWAETH